MYPRRAENSYSECVPPRTISGQDSYYTTLSRDPQSLNLAAISINTRDKYDQSKPEFHFEPMYMDVVSNEPITRKSSRKSKCIVTWLTMLTIISLCSLAFTAFISFNVGNNTLFGDSQVGSNGKNILSLIENDHVDDRSPEKDCC